MGIVSINQKYFEVYPTSKKQLRENYFDITPPTIVQCRAPVRAGDTEGMPPVNLSQRVAATHQF